MHRRDENGPRARRPGGDRLALGCAAFALVLGLSLVRGLTGPGDSGGPPQPDTRAARPRAAYDPRAAGAARSQAAARFARGRRRFAAVRRSAAALAAGAGLTAIALTGAAVRHRRRAGGRS